MKTTLNVFVASNQKSMSGWNWWLYMNTDCTPQKRHYTLKVPCKSTFAFFKSHIIFLFDAEHFTGTIALDICIVPRDIERSSFKDCYSIMTTIRNRLFNLFYSVRPETHNWKATATWSVSSIPSPKGFIIQSAACTVLKNTRLRKISGGLNMGSQELAQQNHPSSQDIFSPMIEKQFEKRELWSTDKVMRTYTCSIRPENESILKQRGWSEAPQVIVQFIPDVSLDTCTIGTSGFGPQAVGQLISQVT